jgi:hypothetical protein
MSSFHNEILYAGFIHDDRRDEDPGDDKGILIRIAIEEICNGEWSISGPFIIPQPNSDSP